MNRIAATLLSVEAVVLLLAVPVALKVSDVGAGPAWLAAGGVAAACVVAAGTLGRRRVGYVIGSLVQVAMIAMGFMVPAMFILGAIFALLWLVLLRVGPAVERAKAARDAG